MSTEETADQFVDLVQRYMRLRPRLIQPEYVLQFKKKMASLKNSSHSAEDHEFLFRIFVLLSENKEPVTMSELSSMLHVPMSTATRISSRMGWRNGCMILTIGASFAWE
jgi:hypothetical protein